MCINYFIHFGLAELTKIQKKYTSHSRLSDSYGRNCCNDKNHDLTSDNVLDA